MPSSQDIGVYVCGTQDLDGTIEREIVVDQLHPDIALTSQQARQLADVLVVALAELEGLGKLT